MPARRSRIVVVTFATAIAGLFATEGVAAASTLIQPGNPTAQHCTSGGGKVVDVPPAPGKVNLVPVQTCKGGKYNGRRVGGPSPSRDHRGG